MEDDGLTDLERCFPEAYAQAEYDDMPENQPFRYSYKEAIEYAEKMGLPTDFPL